MEVMRGGGGDSLLSEIICSLLLAVVGWRKIRRRAVHQIDSVMWTDGVVGRILIVLVVVTISFLCSIGMGGFVVCG